MEGKGRQGTARSVQRTKTLLTMPCRCRRDGSTALTMRDPVLWQLLLMLLIVAFIVKFVRRLVAGVAVIVLGG